MTASANLDVGFYDSLVDNADDALATTLTVKGCSASRLEYCSLQTGQRSLPCLYQLNKSL
jgi:hypothetical protein